MNVFITGSTGYIGYNAARAFRRAGHRVWGLVRTEEKARRLAQNEIRPVLGALQKPDSYRDAVASCSVLVHAAADYAADTFAVDRHAVQTLIDLAAKGARPKTLLYTSGVWVYGNTGSDAVDETSPVLPPARVSARPEIERLVLEAHGLRRLVIRPGCVYGRQGGLTAMWFKAAAEGKPSAIGDGRNRWAMVHVDDLADLYVRAAESGITGEIFNAVDASRSTVREMAEAAARAGGCMGDVQFVPVAEAAKTMGTFAECLALDQRVDAGKAARRLGWHPRHAGFVDDAALYAQAWKAHQRE